MNCLGAGCSKSICVADSLGGTDRIRREKRVLFHVIRISGKEKSRVEIVAPAVRRDPPTARGRGRVSGSSLKRRNGGIKHDADLQEVLDLATEDELHEIYDSLHGRSFFSPVVKSVYSDESISDIRHDRKKMQRTIEARFRFLAANADDMMQSNWPTYRQTLLAIRKRAGVPCSPSLETSDLETEIFLHLLSEHSDYVSMGPSSQKPSVVKDAEAIANSGDGMTHTLQRKRSSGRSVLKGLVSPLKFGSKDIMPALARLATTVVVTRAHSTFARGLGSLVVKRAAEHRAVIASLASSGSKNTMKHLAVETARQNLLGAIGKYSALRHVFSLVAPMLWISTALDLARMSLGTDYARLARTVFMLAQIRLVRTRGWTNQHSFNEGVSRNQ